MDPRHDYGRLRLSHSLQRRQVDCTVCFGRQFWTEPGIAFEEFSTSVPDHERIFLKGSKISIDLNFRSMSLDKICDRE